MKIVMTKVMLTVNVQNVFPKLIMTEPCISKLYSKNSWKFFKINENVHLYKKNGRHIEYSMLRPYVCFLAHLGRRLKVSFFDRSSSVVRRPYTFSLNDISSLTTGPKLK